MLARMSAWVWRLAAAAVVAGALAYIPYRVYGSDGYVHYRTLKTQLGDLERGNAVLAAENARLRDEIGRLRDDLDAVAEVARDELGMVGPGEIVIKIEPPAAAAPPAEAPR
jgi:cell division protein FtsB